MKRTICLLAVLLLSTGLVAGCGPGPGAHGASETSVPQQVGAENVAVVTQGDVETGPSLSGTLEPGTEATVRSQVSGTVVAVHVEMGQRVRRGAALVTLDDGPLQQSLRAAHAGERAAGLSAENARRELARQNRLLAVEGVSRADVEAAEHALAAAEAALADARAAVASAEQQLSRARVTSPITGVVGERSVSVGDAVQVGATLCTIVDPATLRLEASVPADDLEGLRVGSEARFEVRGQPGRTFIGTVQAVSPAADAATRQVRILVSVRNERRNLVARLFASGRVATRSAHGLVLPAEALDRRQVTPSVARIRHGVVQHVDVRVLMTDDGIGRVCVSGALASGDTVLIGQPRELADGTRVDATGAAAAAVSADAAR
jgi:membrane fusion protein, multidrug efflux system